MDRSGADFMRVVGMIKERLSAKPVPLQLPIGAEDLFRGVVDLVLNKAIIFDEENKGQSFELVDVPEDMKDDVDAARMELIEAIAEEDESLLEKYLAGEELGEDEIRQGIRSAVLGLKICPVLCGTAYSCCV